jgi:hypothetical protein
MASDNSVFSRTPALKHAAQPTATAGLLGDRPASTPPAAPITTSPPRFIHCLIPTQRPFPDSSQTIHAAADRPRVTAMARPRALSVPGRGLASETVTITTTRPKARTRSTTHGTSTSTMPVAGSLRVTKPNTIST